MASNKDRSSVAMTFAKYNKWAFYFHEDWFQVSVPFKSRNARKKQLYIFVSDNISARKELILPAKNMRYIATR